MFILISGALYIICNTVWVLPLGAQNLGTQSSRVPKGNTQKNPEFWTLWVPNPKIPIEFRHKPNPYPKFDSGSGITLGYPNFGYPIPTLSAHEMVMIEDLFLFSTAYTICFCNFSYKEITISGTASSLVFKKWHLKNIL